MTRAQIAAALNAHLDPHMTPALNGHTAFTALRRLNHFLRTADTAALTRESELPGTSDLGVVLVTRMIQGGTVNSWRALESIDGMGPVRVARLAYALSVRNEMPPQAAPVATNRDWRIQHRTLCRILSEQVGAGHMPASVLTRCPSP